MNDNTFGTDNHLPDNESDPSDSPQALLADYMERSYASNSFIAQLMNFSGTHEIGDVVQYLPANLYDEFKDTIGWVAAFKKPEDFIVIGAPVAWGIEDAKRVMQWLAENPYPKLAPADDRVYDD